MKIEHHNLKASDISDGHSSFWSRIKEVVVPLMPSPIELTESVSPFMSQVTGHGQVEKINVQMTHDGETLSMRLSWLDPEADDEMTDLDQFPDAAAVMFPLTKSATAITMGSVGNPVNAWFWKADEEKPFDVIAQGYATSERRTAESSGLRASAYHEDGNWTIVIQRSMKVEGDKFVDIEPGVDTYVAFSVWEGSNRERSAQKAVSGEFMRVSVDAG